MSVLVAFCRKMTTNSFTCNLFKDVIHETYRPQLIIRRFNNKKMNKVGKFGEDIACLFLMKHSYIIVERNHLRKWGELDIVAKKENKLYFIEVKTVQQDVTRATGYRPEDNMHKAKIKRFVRIIQTYLQEMNIKNDWQVALIAVRVDMANKKAKVRFIENLIL